MSGLKTNGSSICGSGSRSRSRSICSCCSVCRSSRNAAACARSSASRCETNRSHARASSRIALGFAETVDGKWGEASVDDDRSERDPGAVFDRERGVDDFAHGRLFGERDEHHLATPWIGDQADDVLGLLADRPDADGVEQAARREQEGHRMAGRGRVDDDEVGRARSPRSTSPCRARGCPSCRGRPSRRRRARPTPRVAWRCASYRASRGSRRARRRESRIEPGPSGRDRSRRSPASGRRTSRAGPTSPPLRR